MDPQAAKLAEFVRYVRTYLHGDEKGEAQIFCDRLMQAFGHSGIMEAGGRWNIASIRAKLRASPICCGGRACCWR